MALGRQDGGNVILAGMFAPRPAPGGGGSPVLFGNNSSASPDSFPSSTDRAMASPFALSVDADITSISVRFSTDGTSGDNFKAFIFTDSAGVPGSRVAVSDEGTASAGAWTTVNISASLSAGTYWLGVVVNGFSAKIQCVGSSNTMHMANGTFSYASPPATWPGTDGTYGISTCIYAEGTES